MYKYYIFFFIIILAISIYFYDKPYTKKSELFIRYVDTKKPSNEEKCRTIIEDYFDRKFPKIRHELLINPETNRRLELDCYSKQPFGKYYNGIAFEIDGEQHYYYNKNWHKNRATFNKQIERDKIKSELCKKHGILLIRIPYYIENVKSYIINQLNLTLEKFVV